MDKNYIVKESDLIKDDIGAYLKRHEEKDMLRFLTAGSVDDGKSTLIGRLLYDSKMIYEDQLAAVQKDSKVFGTTDEDFDPALLTDGLKAEREQGITIDVAYRYFSTDKRSFIICDSPGHEQYTRNMATGASHCNLSIILIDARHGVMPQTKRHSFISTLLGIKHLVIGINKMDAVDYDEAIFNKIRKEYESFVAKLDINDIHFIPISALKGDNVVDVSKNMPWSKCEPLLSYLENVHVSSDRNLIDFRFPVQYVIRPNLNFRGFAGTIASGVIRKGDVVEILPSGQKTKIKSIETFDGELEEAFAPQTVVITTTEEVDISRGSMLARPKNVPTVGTRFDANLVWMYEKEMKSGTNYILKTSAQSVPVTISSLRHKFDINNLHRINSDSLSLNDIGRVALTTHRPICFDHYTQNQQTGSFVLIDSLSNATVAAGMIIEQSGETQHDKTSGMDPVSKNIFIEETNVTPEVREKIQGHKPATIWLTGLSGSGKSTIAKALEVKLAGMGVNAFILDGDNVRHGLNKDLGFSVEDRTENIRRISEVAKLMNDAGLIVITAFISPFISDREQARSLIGNNNYLETFIDADINTCRERDPKGLYQKADAGEIKNFTGIDSPYEAPNTPDIDLKTDNLTVEKSVEKIIEELKKRKVINSATNLH